MRNAAAIAVLLSAALVIEARAAEGQHAHGAPPAPKAAARHARHPVLPPLSRTGSGTSWLPDASPMHAVQVMTGDWMFMFHGNVSIGLNDQGSQRGDRQITAINWLMAMATHPFLGGEATARVMVSAEPFTLPGNGYPLLLQTGETWQGQPLHDRQHPHDLFMELALVQRFPISSGLGMEIYLAPVGEPAIGPTAFPHRLSAASDPLAPLGHHWQDATHITYGVVTAGLFGPQWKLEGSWFNGREPDERRYDFDFRVPDSYAVRLSVNPSDTWSTQISWAYLDSPESLHPDDSVHRMTGSVSHTLPLRGAGYWASTLVVGVNAGSHDSGPSALLESNLDVDGHNVIFGRAEVLAKSAGSLVLQGIPADRSYTIASASLGYQHAFGPLLSLTPAVGVRGAVTLVPPTVEPSYGTRVPLGGMIYVQLRPAAQRMDHGAPSGMPRHRGANAGIATDGPGVSASSSSGRRWR